MNTRRNMLVFFGTAAFLGGLGGAWALYRTYFADGSFDWERLSHMMPAGGRALILSLVGSASTGMGPLGMDGEIASGDRIRVEPGGVLTLTLPDRTLLEIRGEAEVDLHVDEFSGGMYNLWLGSLLSVVPTGNQYIATGPTASVGIKGTVFFRQVFDARTRTGRTMEGSMDIPEGINDYFCTCHGEVGYLPATGEPRQVVRRDRAQHHNAYFLRRDGTLHFTKAPMLNHFDDEIDRLIDLQEGEKHDKSWLEL